MGAYMTASNTIQRCRCAENDSLSGNSGKYEPAIVIHHCNAQKLLLEQRMTCTHWRSSNKCVLETYALQLAVHDHTGSLDEDMLSLVRNITITTWSCRIQATTSLSQQQTVQREVTIGPYQGLSVEAHQV